MSIATWIRVYAYRHKRNYDQFGLLEAIDYRDARHHLGSGFKIHRCWLSMEVHHKAMGDKEYKWLLVMTALKGRDWRYSGPPIKGEGKP